MGSILGTCLGPRKVKALDFKAQNMDLTIDELQQALETQGYRADRSLATATFLALALERPLLLEGEPGVGKTELAKALAGVLGRQLIRLQCYDGMELREVLYEWNHAAQLLHMRAAEHRDGVDQLEEDVYQERYLIARPLLQALRAPSPGAVLLIDEVDRADEPFEAFLLEYLGEFQVSIPELGSVRALQTPITILTSNRTRDLNDAVKRRCLYHWLDYPDRERELSIIQHQVPGATSHLAEQITRFVGRLRAPDQGPGFSRVPGIAETIEWARALVALGAEMVTGDWVHQSAGALFKDRDDLSALAAWVASLEDPSDLTKPL